MPSREHLTAPMLLRLQRLAGNRAVGQLLERTRPITAQRVTLGWQGAEADSWNKGETTVTAEGHKAAPGDAGILRIPVTGIAAGRTGADKDEMGGSSDPNIHLKKGQKQARVSSVTTESAGGETGGQAIVIVPTHLPPGPVDILFHLHGHTIGYRQAKHGKGEAPPPRDVMYDRIEQQLLAASTEGLPMIGILPQGGFYSKFGSGDQAGLNADGYVADVFGLGLPELKGLTPGRVTLSGWSGAGLGITQMIGGSKAAAAGKEVPGGKTGSLLPTANFEGLFLFDAIYGSWLDSIWGWLRKQLNKELARLGEIASTDPDTATARQESWLASSGFRFRGIYTARGGCKSNYETLRDTLFAEWFAKHAKGLAPSVMQHWQANYHVVFSGEGVQHNEMIGKQGGPNQENLLKALEMLPKTAAPKPVQGRAPTTLKTRPTTTAAPRRAEAPVVAATNLPAGATPDDLLITAAAALGRAGKGSARPPGGTLLQQEDIRAALGNRAKNTALDARFHQAQALVTALPEGAARSAAVLNEAPALVRVLEIQFILDPTRSALDLLPPERAKHWRDFAWDPNDYPGGPKGAHEAQARRMAEEMMLVRPERRPNIGSTAVVTKDQMTPERWSYIRKHSPQVSGEDVGLFQEAGESFIKMREVAKAEGVTLKILSGYRPPAVAEANAKKADNPMAVASFSSHSLGLAADLQMSAQGRKFKETSTKEMTKVVEMRSTPAHKWMVLRGEEFHWYPFGHEPWHWEYNPPGLKDRYFTSGAAPAKAAAPEVKAAPKPKAAAAAPAVAPAVPAAGATPAGDQRLSGAHWVAKYPTSRTLDRLADPFKGNVTSFIDMLKANKARVRISATYRPVERAWLMHWAWAIANGKVKYAKLGAIENPHNVDIVWDHGDMASSQAAAAQMVSGYAMAHTAALASRHTEGRAVDMTITRLPAALKISDSHTVEIGAETATKNEALHRLAEINYSVLKLRSDPPHWSEDGA